MRTVPYLTFPGNCRQAMQFYQKCLGGKLTFQRIGDAPRSGHLPARVRDCILHASLESKKTTIFATDIISGDGLVTGNSVSLALMCSSQQEIQKLYRALSKEGHADHPVEKTYWNSLFGTLTDQFGVQWLLSCRRVTSRIK